MSYSETTVSFSIYGTSAPGVLNNKTVATAKREDNVKFSPGKTAVLNQTLNCGSEKEELTITVDPSFESRIDIAFAV